MTDRIGERFREGYETADDEQRTHLALAIGMLLGIGAYAAAGAVASVWVDLFPSSPLPDIAAHLAKDPADGD